MQTAELLWHNIIEIENVIDSSAKYLIALKKNKARGGRAMGRNVMSPSQLTHQGSH